MNPPDGSLAPLLGAQALFCILPQVNSVEAIHSADFIACQCHICHI